MSGAPDQQAPARLDPRAKLLATLVLALWIGLLPADRTPLLAPLVLGLVLVGALAGVRPSRLLARAAVSLPFVALPAALGLLTGRFAPLDAAAMAGRGFTAALSVALLSSVTPLPALLHGAARLGAPELLLQTITLTARFFRVLQERAVALAAGARARGFGPGSPQRFTVTGALLGVLVVRSLDRAERVHASMLARGYAGRLPEGRPLRARPLDWLVPTGLAAAAAASLWWPS